MTTRRPRRSSPGAPFTPPPTPCRRVPRPAVLLLWPPATTTRRLPALVAARHPSRPPGPRGELLYVSGQPPGSPDRVCARARLVSSGETRATFSEAVCAADPRSTHVP